jgi:S-adenosylmethionine:tRNA ribosyltransferase-isomerase
MQPISIQDYLYHLPEERIAYHPLPDRDQSKLLVYNRGAVSHAHFKNLPEFLPSNSTLFFNDTRVIPARMHFVKDSGSIIEIFLLNPIEPSALLSEAMAATGTSSWHCMIGNAKRWKLSTVLTRMLDDIKLTASLKDRANQVIEFSWTPSTYSFTEILSRVGLTPLPSYIKRKVVQTDADRYQTVYSDKDGAVAAPTAGLHFTDKVLQQLEELGIEKDFLTLHVSAGTFQPVKSENALEHTMHEEQMVVQYQTIVNLLKPNRFIVSVGTTSLRTLESLYWYGVKLLTNPDARFEIEQDYPYSQSKGLPDRFTTISAIKAMMESKGLKQIVGHTSIYIYPGYSFRICQGLITNFHLPGSTLMLLIAAFVGPDWKKIYNEAIENNYRFLSYGDSSLLIP